MLWSTMINPYKILKHHWSFLSVLSLLPLKKNTIWRGIPQHGTNIPQFMGQLCFMVFHHHQFTILFMVKPQSGDISWWNTFFYSYFYPWNSVSKSQKKSSSSFFIHEIRGWRITHRIHGAAIYGAPWIPSIYPSHVSIYTSTMDPSWVMKHIEPSQNSLAGGIPTPLKNDGVRQLGWWLFPSEWKVIKVMFQTTNQCIDLLSPY